MKIKYGKLLRMQNSLKKIMEQDGDIDLSIKLEKIMKEYNSSLEIYNKVKNKIIKKYAENGKVKKEDVKNFNEELSKLSDTETDVKFTKVKLQALRENKFKLSAFDLEILSDILEG